MRHTPRVFRDLRSDDLTGVGVRYQLRCSCGETGPERRQRSLAVADQTGHISEIAAPPLQRCRFAAPKDHGVTWWEYCQLCADQLPLFDREEVTHG